MRRRGVFRLSAVALAAVLTAGMTGVTTGPADAAAIGWTGTWAVSPQSSGTTFNNQTLRQIVRTSIGGTPPASACRTCSAASRSRSPMFTSRNAPPAPRSIAAATDRHLRRSAEVTIPAGGGVPATPRRS